MAQKRKNLSEVLNPKLQKNPLAQAFGLTLRTLRGDKNASAIASYLGVSNSFIRLLESGGNNLHHGKILKLIDAFPELEYQPLSKLLVAISITDGHRDSISSYKNALSDISSADTSFMSISQKIRDIISIPELKIEETSLCSDDIYTILETHKVDLELISYLSQQNQVDLTVFKSEESELPYVKLYGDTHDQSFINLLHETPSVYVDTIGLNLKNLKNISPNLMAQNSSNWERENSYNFIKLVSVLSNIDYILDEKNIERFDLKYLLNDDFQELQYIILNTDKTANEYEEMFKNSIQKRWGYIPRKNIEVDNYRIREGLKKVQFKSANKDANIIDYLTLSNVNHDYTNRTEKDALWIFVTRNGNKIGFATDYNVAMYNQKYNIVFGETLSYAEAKMKYQQFIKIWETL